MLSRFFKKKPKTTQNSTGTRLRDYLYLDKARLDHFADQIGGPIVADKVPEWNVEVSLGGPKASGRQARPVRSRTDHEKVRLLEDYAAEKNLIKQGRPDLFEDDHEFYQERVAATCGVISSEGFQLKIWVAEGRSDPNLSRHARNFLILIQDHHGDKGYGDRFSSYSGLLLLLSELEWLKGTSLEDLRSELERQTAAEHGLAFQPDATLRKLGFRFGPSRAISAIYRVRAACAANDGKSAFAPTIIGYPIAIWA